MAFKEHWTKPGAIRPQAVICDRMYDWVKFYEKFANEFEYFTRSDFNPTAIHAFQFQRNSKGEVVVVVKDSAVCKEEVWRGGAAEGTEEGWPVLHTEPVGFPDLIPPTQPSFTDKQKKSVLSKKMKRCLQIRGREDAIAWLENVMENGFVPVTDLKPQLPGDVGPRGIIGVPSGSCEVQYLSGLQQHKAQAHQAPGALGPTDASLEVPAGPVAPPPLQPRRQKKQSKFGYKGSWLFASGLTLVQGLQRKSQHGRIWHPKARFRPGHSGIKFVWCRWEHGIETQRPYEDWFRPRE